MINQFKAGDLIKLKISNQPITVKGIATRPSSRRTVLINVRYEYGLYNGK